MAIGKYQLVATVKPSGDGVNRNVTWSSSDESVATVDENGLVTYILSDTVQLSARQRMVLFLLHVILL